MKNIMPKDLVALFALAFIFFFKYMGFDGQLDAMIALIIGYYFAHRADGTDKGK